MERLLYSKQLTVLPPTQLPSLCNQRNSLAWGQNRHSPTTSLPMTGLCTDFLLFGMAL